MTDAGALAKDLAAGGITGVQIAFADNNGIPRSRTVPVAGLPRTAEIGVGITSLFAVFDTHDSITYAHDGLPDASGDVRLLPVLDRLRPLPGQPWLAWAPGTILDSDGEPWPYDQRAALLRQVRRSAEAGLRARAGFELEFTLSAADADDPYAAPGHRGPAYSPHGMLQVDEFAAALLRDAAAAGLELGQLHAEFGPAQLELSLAATDPVAAADDQLLARQVVHAAARANGLRACFAPLPSPGGVGNGWHLHTSVHDDLAQPGDTNLLAGDGTRPGERGAGYVAGLLRDLAALTAITAPSVPSTMRLRPGYFSSAYRFWGVQNREAPLRYVPDTPLLGPGHANVELKPCDASANPYLALTAVLALGTAGVTERLSLVDPISADPGTWSDAERADADVTPLPGSPAEQADALAGCAPLRAALGEQLYGAFRAARASDAAWAAERDPVEIVAGHRWRY